LLKRLLVLPVEGQIPSEIQVFYHGAYMFETVRPFIFLFAVKDTFEKDL